MISVIVPVFNVEPYLHQCVDSIVKQTYRDIEIILIDDGSSDKSGEICDAYEKRDHRVRVFHTDNRGLSAARNLGIQEAKGEYIAFVDSDDWIETSMYELLYKRIQESGADISVCGVWYEYFSSRKALPTQNVVFTGSDALKQLVDEKVSNHVWNKLYVSDLFKAVSFPENKFFEDIVVMHRLFKQSELVAITASYGYHYRQRAGSISKRPTAKSLIDYADALISRYYYIKEYERELYSDRKNAMLRYISEAVSRVWKWWYGCSRFERVLYKEKIEALKDFSRHNIPLFGYKSWPVLLRISTCFTHSSSWVAMIVLYWLCKLRIMICNEYKPEKQELY